MTDALRQRLRWDADGGVFDGPRRYLLMRPDVLMGALVRLDGAARGACLQALAESAREHGAKSLAAYAEQVGGDAEALVAATLAAAADLGWGRWRVRRAANALELEVSDSPFVAGWRAASPACCAEGACAPIRGMFGALAQAVGGKAATVTEVSCAAAQTESTVCRFVATSPAPR